MRTPHRTALAFVALLAAVATSANGQPLTSEEMPVEDYLGLLRQIAPAAETGARTYVAAHAARCGHPLSTAALRRAVAEGQGDPTLMEMIRAAQVKDQAAMKRLTHAVTCQPRGSR